MGDERSHNSVEFLAQMLEQEERLTHEIRCEGVAAYEGLMGMARVIGARERAKPPVSLGLYPCQRRHPDVPVRCNLENDHDGAHKHISQHGNMLHTWPNVERQALGT